MTKNVFGESCLWVFLPFGVGRPALQLRSATGNAPAENENITLKIRLTILSAGKIQIYASRNNVSCKTVHLRKTLRDLF